MYDARTLREGLLFREDAAGRARDARTRRWQYVSAGLAVALVCTLAALVAASSESGASAAAREEGVGPLPAAVAARGAGGAAMLIDAHAKKHHTAAHAAVDPATPKHAADAYKSDGMKLMFSDEFKDEARTKHFFVFEDIPYGVPGNTGDINIVSYYDSKMVEMKKGGGLRLKAEMTPETYKEFLKGRSADGKSNSNYDTLPEQWGWAAPKVTSRLNGRFQYGMVEVRLKAPKGYGPWPASWLNGCYGFVAESSGEFLVQEDYPFVCGQFWPPELDFFEHFSPEHTWYWRPNSQSVHSPNQYVGLGRNKTRQGGYCPTTLADPATAWCFGVSGAGAYTDDPTERYITYGMKWEPEGVSFYQDGHFMVRFTRDQLVLYLSGQLRPITVPEVPLFLTFNIALVRKGMDASHMGPGLTAKENFDKKGEWKPMAMDIDWVRIYQDETQGETAGLNPPITYETRKKLLANRVTCDLIPELRCMVKNSTDDGAKEIFDQSCAKLAELGDGYCGTIDHLCSLNNAANPTGTYGLSYGQKANMANQHLSLVHGVCCIENSDLADEHAKCRDTPKTRLPEWLRESEYFKDPPVGEEGKATGVAGTNPAGWKTYGLGLKPHLDL